MKNKLNRICAFLLALVVLVTTCFTDLPDGSLGFLGDFGEQIVSVLSNDEVEAAVATTTKISLPVAYGSATISEIGRKSEGMWFFETKSNTGSKTTVFCMNSGKSLGSSDVYSYTTTSAVKYSNQSLAKAMTWWFGDTSRNCMNQGAYGSLTSKQTHAAVQAYVWATCTSGASKETTVKQVLQNYCGLSSTNASNWAKKIVNAIADTKVYGTIYYYTITSCGHSTKKGADKHQTLLSWSPDGIKPKTSSYSTSDTDTGSLTITIEIDKKDKSSSKLIDTAVFKVTYGGEALKNAKEVSIKSGSITSAKVTVSKGSYNESTSKFTTSGGKVKFTFKVNYKTKEYETKTYKYVTNWDDLDYWTQLEYSQKGYYQNKSKAQSAAKAELKTGLEKYVESAKTSIRGKTITVKETSAPVGHGMSATAKLSKTAKDALSLTYTFSNPAKYGKVTVNKKEGVSTNYDVDGATLKGAVYGVYAAEVIYDTDNKTVLYEKNEKIVEITTNAKGTASTKNILPVGYDYYVKEIKASKGYTLDKEKHKFSITINSDGDVESATVSSAEDHDQEPKYGKVTVTKKEGTSTGYDVAGAKMKGAVYGVYANEAIYDLDGNLLYKKNAKITEITTNSKGVATSKEVLPVGYDYYVLEITAPAGWTLDTVKHEFSISFNKDGSVKSASVSSTEDHQPEMKYGTVAITKVSAKESAYISDDATLKGATYIVYAAETIYDVDGKKVLYKEGAKVTTLTTKEGGYAKSAKVIPAGIDSDGYEYYLQESKESTGYTLSTTKYYFRVRVDSEGNVTSKDLKGNDVSGSQSTFTYEVKEEPIWGYVAINKYTQEKDGTTNAEGAAVFYVVKLDAVLTATGKTTQSSAKSAIAKMDSDARKNLIAKITASDSSAILSTLTTNSSGYAKSGVLPKGKYMLIQTVGDANYDLEQYYFTITKDSGKTYTYDIYNKENPARISITKTKSSRDESGAIITSEEANAIFYVLQASMVNKSLDELNAMSAAQRQDYVSKLAAAAIEAKLTTDANGEAAAEVSAGTEYIILQTYGDPEYELAYPDKHVFAAGATETYYYEADNPKKYQKFTITKTLSDAMGNSEGAEEGAVFAVIKASYIDKDADEINEMTAAERKSYVTELEETNSSCVIATLTTDENGCASAYWNDSDYDGEFVVIQTYGTEGYAIMSVIYSADATSKGSSSVMKKETGTDADGMSYTAYSFSYADMYEGSISFSINKTLSDTLGNSDGAEEGASFAVIKSAYITVSAAEINEMDAAGRAAYVEELKEADESCIIAELTTDSEGSASASWSMKKYDGDFVVIQTAGVDGYKLMPLCNSADATAEGTGGMKVEGVLDDSGHTVKTYSISWADQYEGSKEFSITKKLSDTKGNESGAEEGASFAVIKSAYITKDADEIDAMTADERSAYVNGIKDADETCVLAELVTDSEGDASASWKDTDYDGEFVVIQTSGVSGYTLMPVIYSADATADGTGGTVMQVTSDGRTTSYTFTYVDAFEDWACIAVYKKYESANGIWKDESGAKFAVLDEAGEEVAWVTTDSEGYGVALDADGSEAALPFGIYYIRQTSSGTDAENTSFIDDELIILTKANRKQTVLYEASNPANDYELTLTKLSDDTGKPVANATYTITAAENIIGPDGSVEFYKNEVVATILTDENGQGKTWIAYGTYYIEESESPYDFVKDTEKVYFTIDKSGITVSGGVTSAAELVTETDEDGSQTTYYSVSYTTYDTPVYGSIYVTKDGQILTGFDSGSFVYTGEKLEGAIYALYANADIVNDAGDVVWFEGEYITSATTDAYGKAQFYWDKDGDSAEECADFYLGDYYVIETYAPLGYTLDTEKHEIVLTWDKTAETENELAEDNTEISDTGESYGSDITYETSGKYVLCTGSVLNELIKGAVTVTFTWSSPGQDAQTTDVSHDGDGSIVMWNDGAGNYYISSATTRQAVIFNGDSSHMFDSCKSLKEICFDCIDTSKVCDMSYMFYMCTVITELDLTYFDTTNVGNFDQMFCGCISLVTIYVKAPDGTGEFAYNEETWTTGVAAEASGTITDGDTIEVDDFSFIRYYTADYITEDIAENITLTSSDIKSITPSLASSENALQWVDNDTYTIQVEIVLSESCQYYCTNKLYSNTLSVQLNVAVPGTGSIDVEESPEAYVDLEDELVKADILIYKEDSDGNAVAGAVFTLYANCNIADKNGNILFNAGDAIMECETLGEVAPCISFEGLPTNIYAVEQSYLEASPDAVYCYADGAAANPAENCMFYVKETTVPAGYDSDGATYYLSGNLSDYTGGSEDGTIVYTFTAVNTELNYVTLQKAWDDASDSSSRPEYVVFVANNNKGSVYYLVMYEDKVYLFPRNGVGIAINSQGVTSTNQLNSALCCWNVKVTTEMDGDNEYEVWSAELDTDGMMGILVSSASSIFTTSSGYTFCENETLLKKLAASYYIENEGWTDAGEIVWRTTNAPESTEYVASKVTKEWDDHENESGYRPTSIIVTLYQKDAAGTVTAMAVRTLSDENDWSAYIEKPSDTSLITGVALEKYDADGNEYSYYWDEATDNLPEGYTKTNAKTYYNVDDDTWYTELTNSAEVTIPVSVQKVWDDDGDAQKIRPDAVYMRLYANGIWVDVNGEEVTADTTADTAVVLNKENDWSATLSGLPKYGANGKEITYKFSEVTSAVNLIVKGQNVNLTSADLSWYTRSSTTGYAASYSYGTYGTGTVPVQTTVTNTHIPNGKVTVYKKILAEDINWANGEPSFTFELTAADGTEYTRTITFTETYVNANTDVSGYVTMEVAFDNLEYGTYTLEETDMPDGWEFVSLECSGGTVSDRTATFVIDSGNLLSTLEAVFENKCSLAGKITIVKYGSDGQTVLSGVEFTISTSDGEKIDTQVTDENGRVIFEELSPGSYRICETATVDGYLLLANELTVTIPLVLTKEQLDDYKAQGINVDISNAIERDGEYCFYELTYEVTDTWNIDLPLTGSMGTMSMAIVLLSLMMILMGFLLARNNSLAIFRGIG